MMDKQKRVEKDNKQLCTPAALENQRQRREDYNLLRCRLHNCTTNRGVAIRQYRNIRISAGPIQFVFTDIILKDRGLLQYPSHQRPYTAQVVQGPIFG